MRPEEDPRCGRPLRARDALWNRKDCLPPLPNRVIHAGQSALLNAKSGPFADLAYQFYPVKRKLIYCSRTVPEIEKALAELKRLMEYRMEMGAKDENFRGMGLTSRKNLCLHPEVYSGSVKGGLGVIDRQKSLQVLAGQQGEERQGRGFEMSGFDFCLRLRAGQGESR